MKSLMFGAAALALIAGSAAAQAPAIAQHSLTTAAGPVAYTTETGFVTLTDASGQPRGKAFYTAYLVKGGAKRPLAFVWNGGPGAPSSWLQFQGLGPKILNGTTFSDNPETPLPAVDMVFIDPVGTGFSRPVSAEAAKDFFSTTGDAKATTQFIQTWVKSHKADGRPVFLMGESFGGYRAGGAAERLESAGFHIAGVVLISGGVASGPLIPPKVRAALTVPQRTAGALALGKTAPDLGKDRGTVVRAATAWALETYLPALGQIDKLNDAEKDQVAKDLSRFTGYPADKVDRKTLTVATGDFLKAIGTTPGKPQTTYDMRVNETPEFDQSAIKQYYASLGYKTDLDYWSSSVGPSEALKAGGKNWVNDYRWPESEKWGRDYAEPWLPAAMKINPRIKVWVAAGLYDALNSCAENDVLASMLEPDLAPNYTFRCYLGGHMMYRNADTRVALSHDVKRFVTATAAEWR
jgi:carboxypeptidase C (cathepsin A)